jgi:polysaccharide biosynthesis protein PslH
LAKILFITSRFPYPLNKGDKLRVFYQLKYLSEKNEIHLIAIDEKAVQEEDLRAVSQFCTSVHVMELPFYKRIPQLLRSPFKGIPLQVAYFCNGAIKRKTSKIVAEINPDAIHCHLIRTAARLHGCIREGNGKKREKRK